MFVRSKDVGPHARVPGRPVTFVAPTVTVSDDQARAAQRNGLRKCGHQPGRWRRGRGGVGAADSGIGVHSLPVGYGGMRDYEMLFTCQRQPRRRHHRGRGRPGRQPLKSANPRTGNTSPLPDTTGSRSPARSTTACCPPASLPANGPGPQRHHHLRRQARNRVDTPGRRQPLANSLTAGRFSTQPGPVRAPKSQRPPRPWAARGLG